MGMAPSYSGQSKVQDKDFLEEVYSDIVGPMPSSSGKNRYFLTFTEFKSRYRYVQYT